MSDLQHIAPPATRSGIDDCWNTIGVRGDASCPKLECHVHCRNCPVYSAAAAHLLDGDVPSEYLADWTTHVARKRLIQDPGTHSVVIFRVGAEWLALATTVVKEVAGLRPIHSLPHRRNGAVLGVANVHGELLVCISLGHILGLGPAPTATREGRAVQQRLLVIHHENSRAVIPVDEVRGTYRFHARELTEVPATVAKAAATYTKAMLSWQQSSVGLLDEHLLLGAMNRSQA